MYTYEGTMNDEYTKVQYVHFILYTLHTFDKTKVHVMYFINEDVCVPGTFMLAMCTQYL